MFVPLILNGMPGQFVANTRFSTVNIICQTIFTMKSTNKTVTENLLF